MKKLSIVTIILFVAALAMVGCAAKTELEFKNSDLSAGAINDIVWADGDASWNSANGWDPGTDTGSKEVSETSGNVTAFVDNGSEFVAADLDKDSLSLDEGESNKVTIVANPPD